MVVAAPHAVLSKMHHVGAVRAAAGGRQTDAAAPRHHIDYALVGSVVLLAAFGVLMVFSATRHRNDPGGLGHNYYFVERQAVFVVIGLVVMAVITLVDYRAIKDFAALIYVATILVLLAVLSPLGSNSKGAQAWIQLGSFQLQPSEFAKIGVILCLTSYLSAHRGDLDFRRFAVAVAIAGVPMLLIQAQPDLGTNLVFGAILLAVLTRRFDALAINLAAIAIGLVMGKGIGMFIFRRTLPTGHK